MDVTFKVKRFDPEADSPAPYWQEYTLQMPDAGTVLDGLIMIREEVDGGLTLRCSCRSSSTRSLFEGEPVWVLVELGPCIGERLLLTPQMKQQATTPLSQVVVGPVVARRSA